MKAPAADKRRLPRTLVAALIVVMAAATLGCILMFAAAQWDRYVLVPIGAILMAAGCALGGGILVRDRALPIVFRALGGMLLVAGLVAVAATVRWMAATWHRF